MHITWERVDRKIDLPRVDKILERCNELEVWIKEFIKYCDTKTLVQYKF